MTDSAMFPLSDAPRDGTPFEGVVATPAPGGHADPRDVEMFRGPDGVLYVRRRLCDEDGGVVVGYRPTPPGAGRGAIGGRAAGAPSGRPATVVGDGMTSMSDKVRYSPGYSPDERRVSRPAVVLGPGETRDHLDLAVTPLDLDEAPEVRRDVPPVDVADPTRAGWAVVMPVPGDP